MVEESNVVFPTAANQFGQTGLSKQTRRSFCSVDLELKEGLYLFGFSKELA